MGNFVPALFWLPFAMFGIYRIIEARQIVAAGLWYMVAATFSGWLGMNLFGLFQNSVMRRQLERILNAEADLPADRVFVGFSSPRYTGILDAHEDIGFLCFTPKALLFVGESRTVELPRSQVQRVCFRPNAHTLVGLGRWISIEGDTNGTPVRMLIEPRERKTMFGNLLYGTELKQRVEKWLDEDAKAPATTVSATGC